MNRVIALLLGFISINCIAQKNNTKMVGSGKLIDPYNYAITKNETFNKAAVVTAHPLASLVGAEILRKGGNVFDAAIATQLTLAVVYPGAGNIGGGGFLLARTNKGKLIGLDYREAAPAKAHRDMYLDKDGNANTNISQYGHLAAGIPGTIAGLFATHKYAKLPFKELIQPAIDIAEQGFVITQREADNLDSNHQNFIRNNTKPVAFVKQDWKKGDTLIQKDLAKTLKQIRDLGAKGFYEGETAKLIVEEMQRGNGIITFADLKRYKVKERKPIQFTYKGHHIISFAPPSSGGLLLMQMMKMIEHYNINQYTFHSAEHVHLMAEVERRAYADRAEHMGDPDFYKVPVNGITNKRYLLSRMKDFDPENATPSTSIKAGTTIPSEETTHISIVDKEGNMVAVTTTLNGGYGSKTVVGGAGFLLNNEMDDFSVKPGVPNMYGAVGGEANAIAPGKRMLSSMTPTLVLKNNKPYIVIGTPGGTTIPTSVFQALVNMIDYKMNLNDAINKSRFHHQWQPDSLFVETDFPIQTITELTSMNHKVKLRTPIGRTEAILIRNGKLEAVADKRGDDSSAGF
jgi:gamma-glutamyltranspeptidase/glutathione hydrolase